MERPWGANWARRARLEALPPPGRFARGWRWEDLAIGTLIHWRGDLLERWHLFSHGRCQHKRSTILRCALISFDIVVRLKFGAHGYPQQRALIPQRFNGVPRSQVLHLFRSGPQEETSRAPFQPRRSGSSYDPKCGGDFSPPSEPGAKSSSGDLRHILRKMHAYLSSTLSALAAFSHRATSAVLVRGGGSPGTRLLNCAGGQSSARRLVDFKARLRSRLHQTWHCLWRLCQV